MQLEYFVHQSLTFLKYIKNVFTFKKKNTLGDKCDHSLAYVENETQFPHLKSASSSNSDYLSILHGIQSSQQKIKFSEIVISIETTASNGIKSINQLSLYFILYICIILILHIFIICTHRFFTFQINTFQLSPAQP